MNRPRCITSLLAECDDHVLTLMCERAPDFGLTLEPVEGAFEDRQRAAANADFVWMCGWPFALARRSGRTLRPVVAPVYLHEERAEYWSAIVARRGKSEPGSRWAVNGFDSNSGYVLPRQRYTMPQIIETGAHAESLVAVGEGRADLAAIDSHVLERERARHAWIDQRLEVLDWVGPDPAPPWTAAAHVSADECRQLRALLLTLDERDLAPAGIQCFAAVDDTHYRALLTRSQPDKP